jgi:hypothetical protein
MHCTYLNPKPAAEPVATCSWQAQRTFPSIIKQYSIYPKLSEQCCHQPQRQNRRIIHDANMVVLMQQTLKEMGHPQTCTPIQTDNSTALTLLTNKILPKALKAMDMQFHWLHCCEAQDQYQFYWRPGTQDLANYQTKHHPASHHKAFWPQILTSATTGPESSELGTPKKTATKSFVKIILLTPLFVEQLAAKQRTIAAKGT